MEQGRRQGCGLAPLLPNVFFAVAIHATYTRFKISKDIMDVLVHLWKKTGTGERGEATAGEPVLDASLWGMLYADDARVVSQSLEQLRRMMEVIVVVCERLASPYWRPRLKSCVYGRRGCRGPPPYSA